jgi:hypothetical protein
VSDVSAAEALDELRARLRDPSILEERPDNPMPVSFPLGTSVTPRRSDPSVATP